MEEILDQAEELGVEFNEIENETLLRVDSFSDLTGDIMATDYDSEEEVRREKEMLETRMDNFCMDIHDQLNHHKNDQNELERRIEKLVQKYQKVKLNHNEDVETVKKIVDEFFQSKTQKKKYLLLVKKKGNTQTVSKPKSNKNDEPFES